MCLKTHYHFECDWGIQFIIDPVSVKLLHKLTKICSTSHTRSIHINALGDGDTHKHTHIMDKSNFKQVDVFLYLKTRCLCVLL